MEQEARDPTGTGPAPGDSDRGPADGSEVERLRRQNRRLEARLESEERRRERLIDRYEALLPDGSAADATAGGGAGAAGPDRGMASAVGYAAWRAATWVRRGLRALRTRR